MVFISIGKYRIIDLAFLLAFGIIGDALGIWAETKLLPYSVPVTFCVSLLIIMVAITRWKAMGLILVPIMSITTYFSGFFIIRNGYDFNMFMTILVGLSAPAISLLWYKFISRKKTFAEFGLTFAYVSVNALLSVALSSVCYVIFANIDITIYLFVYDAFGIILTYVGTYILRSQGMFVEVKESLIEEQIKLKKEKEYEEEFSRKLFEDQDEDDSSSESKK